MNEDTIKVTQLPSAETITQNDLLMIVQNNENKKATSSQFVDMLDDEFANYYDKDETDALLDAKADITDVPTKVSDLTNDSGFIDKDVNNLTNYTKTSDLSAVATSGSYTDLSNTPTIPDMSETYGTSTTDGYSEAYLNNKLVNVGTSVDSNYRTNIISSKNLFDKSTMVLKAYINATTGELANGNDFRTIYIPCKANTTYTIKKIISNRFTWGFTTDNDVNTPKTLIDTNGDSSLTEKTITSPNNSKYMFVMISKITDDTSQLQDILDSIMINEGSTPLPYGPFIQKTINVDNNKFTDTINVGTEIDSTNRVNMLYSKNLFDDTQNELRTNGNVNVEKITNGYKIIMTNAGDKYKCAYFLIENSDELLGKILSLSYTANASTTNDKYIGVFYYSSTTFNVQLLGDNTAPINVASTYPSGFDSLVLLLYANQNTSDIPANSYVEYTNIMLNVGNTPIPYEKYINPQMNIDNYSTYNKPVLLYENPLGTNANIKLLHNCDDFKYIEIFYGSGDGDIVSTRTIPGKMCYLSTIDARSSASQLYIRSSNKLVSGEQISNATYAGIVNYGVLTASPNGNGFYNTNSIKIYKVLGYK